MNFSIFFPPKDTITWYFWLHSWMSCSYSFCSCVLYYHLHGLQGPSLPSLFLFLCFFLYAGFLPVTQVFMIRSALSYRTLCGDMKDLLCMTVELNFSLFKYLYVDGYYHIGQCRETFQPSFLNYFYRLFS